MGIAGYFYLYFTKLYIINLLYVFLMSTGNKLIITLRDKSVLAGMHWLAQ